MSNPSKADFEAYRREKAQRERDREDTERQLHEKALAAGRVYFSVEPTAPETVPELAEEPEPELPDDGADG